MDSAPLYGSGAGGSAYSHGGTLQGRAVAGVRLHAHPEQPPRAHGRPRSRARGRRPRSWRPLPRRSGGLAALFRLLQFAVLPEVLGESAGPTHLPGRQAVQLGPRTSRPSRGSRTGSTRCSSATSRSSSTRSGCSSSCSHCLSCQRLPAGGTAALRLRAGPCRRRARDHHRHGGAHQGDACAGASATRCASSRATPASSAGLPVPRERLPPRGAAPPPDAHRRPVRGRARQPPSDRASAAPRRRTTRSPACTTSATCASTRRSSWRAPSATGATSRS